MKKIVVFAGLLAAPASSALERHVAAPTGQDPRLVRLKQFFESHDCPLSRFAADFVLAADTNDLDWRLLPSISMIESSGGKNYMNKNVLGWGSAQQSFRSVPAGIHAVAYRLAQSKLYRHKALDEILKTYNPRPDYAPKVKRYMQTLGPAYN